MSASNTASAEVKKLLENGKKKGFLTFDEINETLPDSIQLGMENILLLEYSSSRVPANRAYKFRPNEDKIH